MDKDCPCALCLISHRPSVPLVPQAAPLLCAGVTTYAGLKATGARPGEFMTIIGGAPYILAGGAVTQPLGVVPDP